MTVREAHGFPDRPVVFPPSRVRGTQVGTQGGPQAAPTGTRGGLPNTGKPTDPPQPQPPPKGGDPPPATPGDRSAQQNNEAGTGNTATLIPPARTAAGTDGRVYSRAHPAPTQHHHRAHRPLDRSLTRHRPAMSAMPLDHPLTGRYVQVVRQTSAAAPDTAAASPAQGTPREASGLCQMLIRGGLAAHGPLVGPVGRVEVVVLGLTAGLTVHDELPLRAICSLSGASGREVKVFAVPL